MKRLHRRPVVLVTESAYFKTVVGRLRRFARVMIAGSGRAGLMRAMARCDAVLVRVETKLDRGILEAAPRLQLIASATTGINHIDIETVRQRGIRLVHLRGAHTAATAEHSVALMLALMRRIAEVQNSMRSGGWDRAKWIGAQAAGKTIGIVGLGRIGSRVARIVAALGMNVTAYDPYAPRSRFKIARKILQLDRLLGAADVVSIHAALTDETRGMMDDARFRRFKHGAFLVNTARGEILDDGALARALNVGRVAGAALDVFSSEPLDSKHPLRALARRRGNIILTPHLGASTREAAADAANEMADEIERFFSSRRAVRNQSPRSA